MPKIEDFDHAIEFIASDEEVAGDYAYMLALLGMGDADKKDQADQLSLLKEAADHMIELLQTEIDRIKPFADLYPAFVEKKRVLTRADLDGIDLGFGPVFQH